MSLIDRTATPLSTHPPALPSDAEDATAAAAGWRRITLAMLRQEQTNWCWCATTLSVHRYYVPASATKQCEAANRILARNDACVNPAHPDVNRTYYLDKALDRFGHLRSPIVPSALPWSRIKAEIDAGTPVGCRTGWANGGGHFLCIDGYLETPTRMVAVDDPIYGASDVALSVFSQRYQGSGTWTHSYEIKR